MNYLALGILAVGGIVLTLGDLIMKNWVESNKGYVFALGLVVWLIGLICLGFSFRYKNIAVASLIFVLFNVFSLLLFSYFYFKEGLSTYQIIGTVLGIIAIIFLEFRD
jgi:multidrug transporter EmrE-like cation transporter